MFAATVDVPSRVVLESGAADLFVTRSGKELEIWRPIES